MFPKQGRYGLKLAAHRGLQTKKNNLLGGDQTTDFGHRTEAIEGSLFENGSRCHSFELWTTGGHRYQVAGAVELTDRH